MHLEPDALDPGAYPIDADRLAVGTLPASGRREPLFPEPLHVGAPNLGDRDRFLERVTDVLDRRWLTNRGHYAKELERSLADLLGVKHCVVLCNATVALEVAVRATGLTGEVIVPSFTFVASAHALQWLGITPIFCDVDPRTHNLDPRRVEELITPRTTGIMGVHLWGRPCAVDALEAIARRHELTLIFDAAHAFACSFGGRMIGNFGDAEVFSFHATKFFNTFEGGAIATNDDDLARRVLQMSNFGFVTEDTVVSLGTNGKMNEMCAAMGVTLLESLPDLVLSNYRNYVLYRHELSDVPGVTLLEHDVRERCNYQYIVIEVDPEVAGVSRDELVEILRGYNVRARRYFHPGCHRMEPYRTLYPEAGERLAETERLCARVMALPTGTVVGPAAIQGICDLIRSAIRNRRRARTRAGSRLRIVPS
jgi:dTDP-4-amino-4,6-dideoxygalactose transaminase